MHVVFFRRLYLPETICMWFFKITQKHSTVKLFFFLISNFLSFLNYLCTFRKNKKIKFVAILSQCTGWSWWIHPPISSNIHICFALGDLPVGTGGWQGKKLVYQNEFHIRNSVYNAQKSILFHNNWGPFNYFMICERNEKGRKGSTRKQK